MVQSGQVLVDDVVEWKHTKLVLRLCVGFESDECMGCSPPHAEVLHIPRFLD